MIKQNELVLNRDGSRQVLMEALEKVQHRLIIVCPWLTNNGTAEIINTLETLLKTGIYISIGWGYLEDVYEVQKEKYSLTETIRNKLMVYLGWKYAAVYQLQRLEKIYPVNFEMKLLGTHEKFLVCDNNFAMIGSHNLLASDHFGYVREIGIRTTDSNIINDLIKLFDKSYCIDKDEYELYTPNVQKLIENWDEEDIPY